MDVMCVTPILTTETGCENYPRPEVGDKDTVIRVRPHWSGATYFTLVRFGDSIGFNTKHFATLPDASADEMAEVEKEAIANLETVLV